MNNYYVCCGEEIPERMICCPLCIEKVNQAGEDKDKEKDD